MPRKKIQPKPIQIIHCKDFDIEIMEDDWNIIGHGSNKVKEFRFHVNKMVLRMIDDFVDHNHNLKTIMKNKNDYLANASAFARKADEYGLSFHLEDDQQLRKYYYPVVKLEIEKNIRIKANATPPPQSFPLQKLLDFFKRSK